jgi:mannose-6-phosphate isomerase-like protein (cupin superfamily)
MKVEMSHIRAKAQTDTIGAQEILDIFGSTLSVLSDGWTIPVVFGAQNLPSGFAVPMHVHEDDDELFYVLDGELVVVRPEGETKIGRGDCVKLPRGVPHGLRNAADAPARMLVTLAPGLRTLQMLRHFDRAGRAGSLAANDVCGNRQPVRREVRRKYRVAATGASNAPLNGLRGVS